MSKISLGEYLRNLRKRKGKTTRDIGEAIGYSYSYVASIETGRRKPKIDTLEKYIYALSSNRDELLEIKKEISNITNGEYYDKYRDANIVKSDESFFKLLTNINKVNSMYTLENSVLTETIYNFPINDIAFHLEDKYNSKYFRKLKLTDDDRKYIYKLINDYLIRKVQLQKREVEHQFELDSIDKEIANKLIEEYGELIKKLNNPNDLQY